MVPFQACDIEFELRLTSLIQSLLDNDPLGLFEFRNKVFGTDDEDRVAAVVGRPIEPHPLSGRVVEPDSSAATFV